ncbi:glycerol kinase [Vibrio sinensis]|uniref:Glycerol kinase n=1 Tax=Vibrio sinensis TaxID=2302434 RepID=A0A3A6QCG9_9VIBR|nr:glycerol kinase [Vibrio sinensis]RJX65191.1 glycerol kinase [Vibrio sinensis]
MPTKKISTSQLAKLKSLEVKQLFNELKTVGYINRANELWLLTDLGQQFGGEYREHKKFGRYIVWPENLLIDLSSTSKKFLSATQIGERFKLNAKKVNQLFNELGWIDRSQNGWQATNSGLSIGAQQREDLDSKTTYVVWHDSVVKNLRFKQTILEFLGHDAEAHSTDKSLSNFRQKFEAKHRTLDGHYVRSKGELIIDNWLYMNGIVHAYNRQLPIRTDMLSDFYLPSGKVYLQYWGDDKGETEQNLRNEIRSVYQEHDFELIEVYPSDIEKLDEVLPIKLRHFGIKAY